MNSRPMWIPFLVVGMMAVSTWGTLHIYTNSAIRGLIVSHEIGRVVSGVSAVGNLIAALGLVAYWPVITLLLWTAGALLNGETPEYKALLHEVGMAVLPIAFGTFVVWFIAVMDPPIDFASDVNFREYLRGKPSVRLGQSVMIIAYAGSLIWLVTAVRRLFCFSWIRAATAVLAPLGIVGICRMWI